LKNNKMVYQHEINIPKISIFILDKVQYECFVNNN